MEERAEAAPGRPESFAAGPPIQPAAAAFTGVEDARSEEPVAIADEPQFTLTSRGEVSAEYPQPPNGHDELAQVYPGRDRADEPEVAPAGPNLMLSLVCWIGAATALFEAFALYSGHWTNTYAFTGYLTLGLGLVLFGLEAISWARANRFWLYLPAAILTIIGVVSLVLSHAPGRRI